MSQSFCMKFKFKSTKRQDFGCLRPKTRELPNKEPRLRRRRHARNDGDPRGPAGVRRVVYLKIFLDSEGRKSNVEEKIHHHSVLTVCRKCVARFFVWSWQTRNDSGKNNFLSVKLYISRPPPPESMLVLFWFDNEQVFSKIAEHVGCVLWCAFTKSDHLHTN